MTLTYKGQVLGRMAEAVRIAQNSPLGQTLHETAGVAFTQEPMPPPGQNAIAVVSTQSMFSTVIVRRPSGGMKLHARTARELGALLRGSNPRSA